MEEWTSEDQRTREIRGKNGIWEEKTYEKRRHGDGERKAYGKILLYRSGQIRLFHTDLIWSTDQFFSYGSGLIYRSFSFIQVRSSQANSFVLTWPGLAYRPVPFIQTNSFILI